MDEEFIYLDNAATTWPKPPEVQKAVADCLVRQGANPGRSSHRMSLEAERIIEETRFLLARFFNAPSPDHVIFTLNCTDSLNMALKGLLHPGDRVITGPYEHNSVIRPLRRLERKGVSVSVIRGTRDFCLDLAYCYQVARQGVDLAVMSHASNVTGCTQPVREMAEAVHEMGGVFILDAAQTAGRVKIDMEEMGIDILAAPGHKGLYGPMGTGILVLGRNIDIEPFREGGTGFRSEDEMQPLDLPWHLEAGTPNLPGIAGLRAAIRFIQKVSIEEISRKETEMARTLYEALRGIPGVRLFCPPEGPKNGIVSFTIDGCDVSLAGTILDQVFGIGVRTGLHCAPQAHKSIGTFPSGTIRASFGYFNTFEHVERLVSAVRQIAARSPGITSSTGSSSAPLNSYNSSRLPKSTS
ncbi:MAG TPA: aminotransferase class V-fold PLP-dependent enzyme [Firmicutes bacterium]|nr:aminotransferase class V-fold PLP-dependent enzyme [Candidatus Fermentithermobacillaceae bacterium]